MFYFLKFQRGNQKHLGYGGHQRENKKEFYLALSYIGLCYLYSTVKVRLFYPVFSLAKYMVRSCC